MRSKKNLGCNWRVKCALRENLTTPERSKQKDFGKLNNVKERFMRKSLLSFIFAGLMITLCPAAHADQWVAVTYLIGTTTGEYSGLVDDATFSQITGKLDQDA